MAYHHHPKDSPLIIVGAGVFGLGLAYELAAVRGYNQVIVLDRFAPPVPDGSSVDVSRVIRAEYADPIYAQLSADALKEWRGDTPWSKHYNETGFIMLGTGENGYGEIFEAHETDQKLKELYPDLQADLAGLMSLRNTMGGWADAANAIRDLAESASRAGVSFITGSRGTVISLEYSGRRIVGVKTASGDSLKASTVVLATGSWTNLLVPDMGHNLSAVGQPIAFVQLTPEEAKRLQRMPVMQIFDTGLFTFPPTPDTHRLKIARHGYGYASSFQSVDGRSVSSPKLIGNNVAAGFLPHDAEETLRAGLRKFFPEFGDRPWESLRMCWYQDTPDGDFVVDHHSDTEGLFFATGGSGHAFKFLPVLGRNVADVFEGKVSEELREKWRIQPMSRRDPNQPMGQDGSRGGPVLRRLSVKEQSKL
ncbi:FAD dependent oxidoreductase [Fusarium keratoplasticum]|uniref:FAD dependent oxidoreductase n=1 Tax=Fusarium keratoplasticum TaxID=1328300 RepID=A0ACC0R2D1_9HYPO|nr:FAD dependent oxidoreductase [Fusarium keratoplasticum]KAI8674455.1 FAD dependent oxidoreductase [Fusarium keratoplasticum]KAI8680974.1 FAD dependent oxidoreductase [Fusarium keratoplasticum]